MSVAGFQPAIEQGETDREINRGGSFADPTFLVGYRDQPPHIRILPIADSFLCGGKTVPQRAE
jgi:hypothetical protein